MVLELTVDGHRQNVDDRALGVGDAEKNGNHRYHEDDSG